MIVTLLCVVLHAAPARATPVQLKFQQQAQTDGGLLFSVRGLMFSNAKLFAPDGTSPPRGSLFAEDLTYAELSSRFFGTWTIEESLPVPASYSFSLTSFAPHSIATIVGPADGAIVPTEFQVDWDYLSGPPAPGQSLGTKGHDPSSSTVSFAEDGAPQATILVDLAGLSSTELTILAGGYEVLYGNVSQVTPLDIFGFPKYEVTASIGSQSLPVMVTVVPEPTGFLLAALALAGLLWRRWRLAS